MAFFETHLIKLDFTAKAQSTQRTAFCLLSFNTCFSLRAQCLYEAGVENCLLPIGFVDDPK